MLSEQSSVHCVVNDRIIFYTYGLYFEPKEYGTSDHCPTRYSYAIYSFCRSDLPVTVTGRLQQPVCVCTSFRVAWRLAPRSARPTRSLLFSSLPFGQLSAIPNHSSDLHLSFNTLFKQYLVTTGYNLSQGFHPNILFTTTAPTLFFWTA